MSEYLFCPVEIDNFKIRSEADCQTLFQALFQVGLMLVEDHPEDIVMPLYVTGSGEAA